MITNDPIVQGAHTVNTVGVSSRDDRRNRAIGINEVFMKRGSAGTNPWVTGIAFADVNMSAGEGAFFNGTDPTQTLY